MHFMIPYSRTGFMEAFRGKSTAETTEGTIAKGHGRREWRTLETSSALKGWLNWPGHEQVCRHTCRRLILKTGEIEEETTYAVTSLPKYEAKAPFLERFWRGALDIREPPPLPA